MLALLRARLVAFKRERFHWHDACAAEGLGDERICRCSFGFIPEFRQDSEGMNGFHSRKMLHFQACAWVRGKGTFLLSITQRLHSDLDIPRYHDAGEYAVVILMLHRVCLSKDILLGSSDSHICVLDLRVI